MRLFEILDKMNVADGENKTGYLGVCDDVVAINVQGTTKGTVTVGVPGNVASNLILKDDHKAILLVIDLVEYEKIKRL